MAMPASTVSLILIVSSGFEGTALRLAAMHRVHIADRVAASPPTRSRRTPLEPYTPTRPSSASSIADSIPAASHFFVTTPSMKTSGNSRLAQRRRLHGDVEAQAAGGLAAPGDLAAPDP